MNQTYDDEAMDYEMGVLLLNLIADFWDLKTQISLLDDMGKINDSQGTASENASRPSTPGLCPVPAHGLRPQESLI